MKRSLFLIVLLLLATVQTAASTTQLDKSASSAVAETPSVYTEALGIGMESYPYPYPVKFLTLSIEGQTARMAYMDVPPSGRETGQTVVLLHGKNFYGSYWEDTIKALTAAGYRVIVPDQIGFGKSAKPDISYSFDLLAANTVSLLDSLQIQKVAIVGHSMGGMLAVRFARNYPERTTHLVLENPIGLEDYRFKVPPQTTERLVEAQLKQTTQAYRAFLKRYFVTWKPQTYERFVEVRSRIALSGEFPRWAKADALTYQMIYQQPVRHEFSLIKPPTLLVIGQEDRTTLGRNFVTEDVLATLGQFPQLGKAAAKDIPNSKLVELDNVGHIPHLEAPEAFHQALLDFLK
ncbi:MAG TPA: alpha/beta hydrolase [Cyanobacteria bacterium UBA8553]|nr:alpha/beta hydrolase [Cyanobacteria bacterium UBA8553]HAJ62936.1 alpha/beta hydrolase [Cyanobacteria bacterium UBA8543]